MLDDLFDIHTEILSATPDVTTRFIYPLINWDNRAICVTGARGVGKTTLLCQHLLEKYKTVDNALYIFADNILVSSMGLYNIARKYFAQGGSALYIDEVHKYPDWSVEIKNIIDTYSNKQIIFSGSSEVDLIRSKADLSRRVVYYTLPGLSFREYLNIETEQNFPSITLNDLIQHHTDIAIKLKKFTVLKHFKNYLNHGYYPFYLQGIADYHSKLNNVIEKIIYEDIAVLNNIRVVNIPILKKVLWLITSANGLIPNVDQISKNLQTSREMIYNCFDYLQQSSLSMSLYHDATGMKLVRKPGKIYLNNTSLLITIHRQLKSEEEIGAMRETFFANQIMQNHKIALHEKADFIVDGKIIIEIGGRSKKQKQIQNLDAAFLAVDDIEMGVRNRIPMYLFGFLY